MALTKSLVDVQASTTCNANSSLNSAWFSTEYGFSGVAFVTNGGTGPSAGCSVFVDLANDGSGANAVLGYQLAGTAGTANSGAYSFSINLGVMGQGADAPYARVRWTGNTNQNVTVSAAGWKTTALA